MRQEGASCTLRPDVCREVTRAFYLLTFLFRLARFSCTERGSRGLPPMQSLQWNGTSIL